MEGLLTTNINILSSTAPVCIPLHQLLAVFCRCRTVWQRYFISNEVGNIIAPSPTGCFGLHFCRRKFWYILQSLLSNVPPKATKFDEITQNKDHYVVQGHSMSPISVPIESS